MLMRHHLGWVSRMNTRFTLDSTEIEAYQAYTLRILEPPSVKSPGPLECLSFLSFYVFSSHISMVSHSFTSSPKYSTNSECDYYLHGPPENTLCFYCSRRKALFWIQCSCKTTIQKLAPYHHQRWYYCSSSRKSLVQTKVKLGEDTTRLSLCANIVYNTGNLSHRFSHKEAEPNFAKFFFKVQD